MIERLFARNGREWVPAGLDTIPPGCVSGAMLDDIDLHRCTGFDRNRGLPTHQRMASHYTAQTCHTMNKVLEVIDATDIETDFVEQAAAEIGATLRLTR